MLIYYRDDISPKHCSLKFWRYMDFPDQSKDFWSWTKEHVSEAVKAPFFMFQSNLGISHGRSHNFFFQNLQYEHQ